MNRSLTEPVGSGRAHPRRSAADRFESAYRRCWAALRSPTDPDLTWNERELLRCVGDEPDGIALTGVSTRLGWPKSTTSVLAKDLEGRGLLARRRRVDDERRLAITLTATGAARVEADRLLESRRLVAALRVLSPIVREELLAGLEQLAGSAERLPADHPGSGPVG
ncbi:MAG TPA: MarR family transcriptional regulator [Acidimicrobiia bacterium]|nr:MarR family transcriptional regulator [Acidimicrobiia bacterium]